MFSSEEENSITLINASQQNQRGMKRKQDKKFKNDLPPWNSFSLALQETIFQQSVLHVKPLIVPELTL